MRDLKKYAAECMSVLDDLGIRYAPIIRFSVNTRASTRLGLCRKRGECYEIEISSLLLDERTPADSLRDTLWHELLHTCRGCMKHRGQDRCRGNSAAGLARGGGSCSGHKAGEGRAARW